MNVFQTHADIVCDYAIYIRSFLRIDDPATANRDTPKVPEPRIIRGIANVIVSIFDFDCTWQFQEDRVVPSTHRTSVPLDSAELTGEEAA
jgi:hypothetical protein